MGAHNLSVAINAFPACLTQYSGFVIERTPLIAYPDTTGDKINLKYFFLTHGEVQFRIPVKPLKEVETIWEITRFITYMVSKDICMKCSKHFIEQLRTHYLSLNN